MANTLNPILWPTSPITGKTVGFPVTPTVASQTVSSNTSSTVKPNTSAVDAHKMLISTAFGIFIIVMAVIIAGINDKWGTAMVWVMVALIVLQGLFNVANLAQFVQNESFLPVSKTG